MDYDNIQSSGTSNSNDSGSIVKAVTAGEKSSLPWAVAALAGGAALTIGAARLVKHIINKKGASAEKAGRAKKEILQGLSFYNPEQPDTSNEPVQTPDAAYSSNTANNSNDWSFNDYGCPEANDIIVNDKDVNIFGSIEHLSADSTSDEPKQKEPEKDSEQKDTVRPEPSLDGTTRKDAIPDIEWPEPPPLPSIPATQNEPAQKSSTPYTDWPAPPPPPF